MKQSTHSKKILEHLDDLGIVTCDECGKEMGMIDSEEIWTILCFECFEKYK